MPNIKKNTFLLFFFRTTNNSIRSPKHFHHQLTAIQACPRHNRRFTHRRQGNPDHRWVSGDWYSWTGNHVVKSQYYDFENGFEDLRYPWQRLENLGWACFRQWRMAVYGQK